MFHSVLAKISTLSLSLRSCRVKVKKKKEACSASLYTVQLQMFSSIWGPCSLVILSSQHGHLHRSLCTSSDDKIGISEISRQVSSTDICKKYNINMMWGNRGMGMWHNSHMLTLPKLKVQCSVRTPLCPLVCYLTICNYQSASSSTTCLGKPC